MSIFCTVFKKGYVSFSLFPLFHHRLVVWCWLCHQFVLNFIPPHYFPNMNLELNRFVPRNYVVKLRVLRRE